MLQCDLCPKIIPKKFRLYLPTQDDTQESKCFSVICALIISPKISFSATQDDTQESKCFSVICALIISPKISFSATQDDTQENKCFSMICAPRIFQNYCLQLHKMTHRRVNVAV